MSSLEAPEGAGRLRAAAVHWRRYLRDTDAVIAFVEKISRSKTGVSRARFVPILRGIGTPIGPYDVLMAGQATARDRCVVTNTTREFKRVANLEVEDRTPWRGLIMPTRFAADRLSRSPTDQLSQDARQGFDRIGLL